METVITLAAITAMILIGMLLIHLLNGRHDERIAAFHYSEPYRESADRAGRADGRQGLPDRPSSPPTASTATGGRR
ncbi:hypothetical protein H1V43_21900 [Streptomyces sp. PSKA54]|uniref:Uncharacterized protein n=1 Tax=Streptomyces himalayensis subsp. aureolus TaxID=2758039 RepID=A0A7W2D3A9_9ACTN|nr:hypothetical protein [Streptomyces himalayensis]MBA4863961.1 hypothetical protein [Streptomyces himalayensis subsp. aureolus]